jgi:hypothetical protein
MVVTALQQQPGLSAPLPDNIGQRPSAAFVCCIEAGPLEAMVIRLATSIRRHGGRFSNCPILVFRPRAGAPVSRATRAMLKALDATLHDVRSPWLYWWNQYFGKAKACKDAELLTNEEIIIFLDSDALILDEPSELMFAVDDGIVACPGFDKGLATTGPGDERECTWMSACAAVGMDIESLPWVRTAVSHTLVRLYFNGGVFAFRRGREFGAKWLETYGALTRARITFGGSTGVNGVSELTAAIAAVQAGLRFRPLSHSHNYSIPSWQAQTYRGAGFPEARILHYHSAMAPESWDRFLAMLSQSHPSTTQWLATLSPIHPRGSMMLRAIRAVRSFRRSLYLSGCRRANKTADGFNRPAGSSDE